MTELDRLKSALAQIRDEATCAQVAQDSAELNAILLTCRRIAETAMDGLQGVPSPVDRSAAGRVLLSAVKEAAAAVLGAQRTLDTARSELARAADLATEVRAASAVRDSGA